MNKRLAPVKGCCFSVVSGPYGWPCGGEVSRRHEVGAHPVQEIPEWVSHLKVLSFLSGAAPGWTPRGPLHFPAPARRGAGEIKWVSGVEFIPAHSPNLSTGFASAV